MSDIPSTSLGLEPKQHEWCTEDKGTCKKPRLMYCLIAGTVLPDRIGFRFFFFFFKQQQKELLNVNENGSLPNSA